MPKRYHFGRINSVHSELTVPLANGCGFNRYRDARGICRRKYVFERYQENGGVNSHPHVQPLRAMLDGLRFKNGRSAFGQ